MMKRLILTLLFAGLALSSCVGTDVGNPQESDVEIDVKGYESTNASALTLPSGLRIDSAWISLSQFEFRPADDCDARATVVEQPILVDVISNQTVTERPTFSTDAGQYCRLDASFIPWSGDVPEGAPDAIVGQAIVVEGARADGTEFVVRSDMDIQLRMNATNNAFALDEGTEKLIIGFAIDEWFNESALDAIDPADEPIIIDQGSNTAVWAQFNAALRRSSRLFRDDDGDNEIGMSERADELARGEAASEQANNGQ